MIKHIKTMFRIAYLETRIQYKFMLVAFAIATLGIISVSLTDWQSPDIQKAAASWTAQQQQTKEPPIKAPDLKGMRIVLQGDPAAIKSLAEPLSKLGAQVVERPQPHDFRLTQKASQDGIFFWQARKIDAKDPQLEEKLTRALSYISQQNNEVWTKEKPAALYFHKMLMDTIGEEPTVPLADILLLGILIILAYIMMLFKGSMVGVEWDMDRTSGRLEPWTLVSEPLWALYIGQALGGALQAAVLLLASFTLAKLCGFGIPWGLGLAIVWMVSCISILVGVYGVLATMMFRHRFGRTFSRILLSPLNLMLFSGYYMLQKEGGSPVGQWVMGYPALIIVISGVVTFLAAMILIPIIEWRIGARREGLRKL